VHVLLIAANDAQDIDNFLNEGDQEYKLSANTDFTRYSTVAIYCERFHAVFGTATLQPF
jgi:hypothetical protein